MSSVEEAAIDCNRTITTVVQQRVSMQHMLYCDLGTGNWELVERERDYELTNSFTCGEETVTNAWRIGLRRTFRLAGGLQMLVFRTAGLEYGEIGV